MANFFKTKVLHLLAITEIWMLIYFAWNYYFEKMPITLNDLLKELLFLRQSEMNHMWYMPVLLILYCFVPFIANALNRISNKYLLIIWFVCVICSFGFVSVNIVLNIVNKSNIQFVVDVNCVWVSYLLAGYIVKKEILKKINGIIVTMIALVSLMSAFLLQVLSYKNGITYNIWYDLIFMIILGMAVFELFSRSEFRGNVCVRIGAKYSFGVYLVHNIIKSLIKKYVFLDSGNKMFDVLCYWGLILLISYMVAFIISKIPKVGKFLLYMK